MKIIFYSNKCNYCIKVLTYLDTINCKSLFKLINIEEHLHNNNKIKDILLSVLEPNSDNENITNLLINEFNMPILIDSNLNQVLKGKDVFEYISNIKYFNISTNNIKNIIPDNPIIMEDEKAISKDNNCNLQIKNDQDLLNNKIIPNKKFKYYLLNKK